MSKVTRYYYDLQTKLMRKNNDGNYVLYSDYAKLERMIELLKSDKQELSKMAIQDRNKLSEIEEEHRQVIGDLYEEINDLEARVKELEAKHRWIPIDEDLPDYDEFVLFYEAETGYSFVSYVDKDGNPHLKKVTHWRRIDAPEQ